MQSIENQSAERSCASIVEAKGGCSVRVLDPLREPGWDRVLATHEGAGFFEGTAWARVLRETYGHRPFYFCRIEDGRLEALLPCMEVASVLTGRRGVSLPFTDLCAPLTRRAGEVEELRQAAEQVGRERGWKYFERRGVTAGEDGAERSLEFYGHEIELGRTQEELLGSFEPAVRRGIRKAEKSGVRIGFGSERGSVEEYYRLHCMTRKRHGVPPQPLRFFEAIAEHVLRVGAGFVVTASEGGRAIGSAIFFHQNGRAFYKFGASDYRYQQLRPNNLVMWEGIRRCRELGCGVLHLGRTSMTNEGLRQFKLGFGAREGRIYYTRYDYRRGAYVQDKDRATGGVTRVFRLFPIWILRLIGRGLYPHLS